MSSHQPGTDPQPDRGRDNEHRPDKGGRPVKPTTSAPKPTKKLSELNSEFWHDITPR
ncbi:hypothetical protein GCM10010989_00750 [Croceicoccus pelagius]|uniref:Uncharacterized protein n=1 Tax=Croceicoccus pelagius TaxID=1703341 RepID=A0A917DED8_9SPHN|nr:hypothetical protein GCM10010989_00750 [Croceicoccus pelagius]